MNHSSRILKFFRAVATMLVLAVVATGARQTWADDAATAAPPALDFTVDNIQGEAVDLTDYQGKTLLVVNVASKCGLTPQYEELQALHDKYADQGFEVLGFPCNQFGQQEPGTHAEIQEFCEKNYKVTFPLFAKVDVNGPDAAPLYKYLTGLDAKPKGAGDVNWNFEKFLIGKDGTVLGRFSPRTRPNDRELNELIETDLQKE